MANAFIPRIIGENGFVKDALVSTFTSQSIYDSPLWFLYILFWGSLLVESIERIFTSRVVKNLIYISLYILVMRLETVDWRLPYIGFILVGAIKY